MVVPSTPRSTGWNPHSRGLPGFSKEENALSRPRSGPRERAHHALEDWASFLLTSLSSQELGYQMAQLDVERSPTPPGPLIPHIAFTPYTVRCIQNYYDNTTKRMQTIAYLYYIAEPAYKRQVSKRQHGELISNVSKYLTGLSQ